MTSQLEVDEPVQVRSHREDELKGRTRDKAGDPRGGWGTRDRRLQGTTPKECFCTDIPVRVGAFGGAPLWAGRSLFVKWLWAMICLGTL